MAVLRDLASWQLEFTLSTYHQFYRSASLQTPAIVANEWSSASILWYLE